MSSQVHRLTFRATKALPVSDLPAPPPGTTRTFIETPGGRLEILIALPAPFDVPNKSPVLFVHGGFGSAECYSNYLPYFAARGYPSYSLSLRGHGNSWYPSFLRMCFTPKHSFATDLATVCSYVSVEHRGAQIALVGHSAGGGLSQYTLHAGLLKHLRVRAMGLIAAFPNFGGYLVYWKWLILDPWYPLRVIKDFVHPRSPLSSTNLVHRAFFSEEYPTEQVQAFERRMPEYESLMWPSGMMLPFVSCRRVLGCIFNKVFAEKVSTEKNPIEASAGINAKPKVLIIAGEQDALMGVRLMRWMAQSYARAAGTQLRILSDSATQKGRQTRPPPGVVTFYLSPKSGHNLMKDLYWEDSASRIAEFLDAAE